MKFVDEIILNACSGNGGNGVIRWHTSKGNPKGGPAGGNGGRGGDVYIQAVRDVALLSKYRGNNEFKASHGGDGGGSSLHGKNGMDMTIDLPVGSVVTLSNSGIQVELKGEGEKILILKGGVGGYGNEHFKGSRNISPKKQIDGKRGECSELQVELKLIADAGLVGYPNAGKSSLLNALTRAHAKVGNYQFTTLDPNLGDMYLPTSRTRHEGGYILADIPGLLEGASEGKGLGDKFLRHIERTKTLLHCISVEREDIKNAYSAVRAELKAYNPQLLKKEEVIILTKTDLISDEKLEELKRNANILAPHIFTASILDDESIKNLRDKLIKIL